MEEVKETPVVEETTQEVVETNVTENEPVIKKRKKGWIVALVVLGLLIIAGILLMAFGLKKNPKQVFNYAVKKANTNANNYVDNYLIDIKEGFVSNGTLSIESNIDGFKELSDVKLSYNYGANIKENNLEMDFKLDERKQSLAGTFYIQDNKIYMDSKDLYESPLYLTKIDEELNIEQIFAGYNKEDMSYMVDAFTKYLQQGLEHAEYKTGKHALKIDGKKVNVTDNMMIINEKNLKNVVEPIINGLKDDSKALDIISKMTSVDKKEIVEALQELLEELNGDISEGKIVVHIYTKGITSQPVGYKFSVDDEDLMTIVDTDKEFAVNIEDMLFKAVKKDAKTYDLSLESYGTKVLKGTYIKHNDNKADISLDMQGVKLDLNINNKITNNKQSADVKLNLNMMGQYITLKMNNETDLDKKVSKYDTSKAKSYSSLDEKEQEKIMTNFANKMESSSIYKSIESFSSLYSYDDYDYDYSYDDFDFSFDDEETTY